jgi:hypothetical protein
MPIFHAGILNCSQCFAGDNELYIAGGDNFGAAVYSMYKWCPEENMFEDMAGMQIARKQFVFSHIIFVNFCIAYTDEK